MHSQVSRHIASPQAAMNLPAGNKPAPTSKTPTEFAYGFFSEEKLTSFCWQNSAYLGINFGWKPYDVQTRKPT